MRDQHSDAQTVLPHLKQKVVGNRFQMTAVGIMGCLVAALLITNYISQRSILNTSIERMELDLNDRARSLAYILSEREGDIKELADTTTVQSFFTNRNLGMSMQYGLKASLSYVFRLFEKVGENRLIGQQRIYSALQLHDADGSVLTSWSQDGIIRTASMSHWKIRGINDVELINHHDGFAQVVAPVLSAGKIDGFVTGWISYQTLLHFEFVDYQGIIQLLENGKTLYSANHSNIWVEATGEESSLSAGTSKLSKWMLRGTAEKKFAAQVPGYDLRIELLESVISTRSLRSFLIFMGGLIVTSLTVLGIILLTLQAGAKTLVLEASLQEAKKQKDYIAGKNEQLNLVLYAAELGTWSLNIKKREFSVNERWCEMFGYERSEVDDVASFLEKHVHPEDYRDIKVAFRAHLSGETEMYSSEYRLRHRDSHWVWVYTIGKVMERDQDENPLRAFGIVMDITGRKEAVKNLKQAKAESDRIIKDFLDTLIIVNQHGVITRVNTATCSLLGYEEEELLHTPVIKIFHDPPAFIRDVFSFRHPDRGEKEKPAELRNIELCYRKKDGTRLPMSFNISPLYDDGGNTSGAVAGAKDISHLREALDHIENQKNYIEQLFDMLPYGLLALSDNGKIVKRNRAYDALCRKLFGRVSGDYLFDSPLYKKLKEIIDAKRLKETVQLDIDFENSTFHLRCSIDQMSTFGDNAYLILIENITAKVETEAERRLLSTVVEQMADSVLVTEHSGEILYVNPATTINSGYANDELIGTQITDHFSGRNDEELLNSFHKALKDERCWKGQLIMRRKDKTMAEEELSLSPVVNDEGQITNFVAIKRDLTEMASLQRQLIHAQKMEAVGQLAAGIAHEINTPMQYIQNNISFLEQSFSELADIVRETMVTRENREEEIDEDTAFLLEEVPASMSEVQEGIARVVKIVLAMKDFSHPQSDQKVLTDLNRVLESTITVCRNEWKYVAEMVTDLAVNLPPVRCFPDKMNQAILNLLVNAAQAIDEAGGMIPENPGKITVVTKTAGELVEIIISDSGAGISEEIRTRIFEPFFTTKEVGKGTGQGLSIVHNIIVEEHGGSILVEQPEEGGSRFVIQLPVNG